MGTEGRHCVAVDSAERGVELDCAIDLCADYRQRGHAESLSARDTCQGQQVCEGQGAQGLRARDTSQGDLVGERDRPRRPARVRLRRRDDAPVRLDADGRGRGRDPDRRDGRDDRDRRPGGGGRVVPPRPGPGADARAASPSCTGFGVGRVESADILPVAGRHAGVDRWEQVVRVEHPEDGGVGGGRLPPPCQPGEDHRTHRPRRDGPQLSR